MVTLSRPCEKGSQPNAAASIGVALAFEALARGAKVYAGARDPSTVRISDAVAVQLDVNDESSVARSSRSFKCNGAG